MVELNGSGSRYGFDDRQTHRNLLQRGFTAHVYDPRSRSLRTRDGIVGQNTIYVRPVAWVQRRLETAPRIEVLDQVL